MPQINRAIIETVFQTVKSSQDLGMLMSNIRGLTNKLPKFVEEMKDVMKVYYDSMGNHHAPGCSDDVYWGAMRYYDSLIEDEICSWIAHELSMNDPLLEQVMSGNPLQPSQLSRLMENVGLRLCADFIEDKATGHELFAENPLLPMLLEAPAPRFALDAQILQRQMANR